MLRNDGHHFETCLAAKKGEKNCHHQDQAVAKIKSGICTDHYFSYLHILLIESR